MGWYLPVSICLFVSPLSMSTRTGAYTQFKFWLERRNSLIPSLPFYLCYRSWPSAIRHSVISNLFPTRLKATPLKRSLPKLRALSGDHPTQSSYLYSRRPPRRTSGRIAYSVSDIIADHLNHASLSVLLAATPFQITSAHCTTNSEPQLLVDLPSPSSQGALIFFRAFLGPRASPRTVVRTPSGLSSYGKPIQLNSIQHSVTDWPPSSIVHRGWAAYPFYRCLYLYQSRKMIGYLPVGNLRLLNAPLGP